MIWNRTMKCYFTVFAALFILVFGGMVWYRALSDGLLTPAELVSACNRCAFLLFVLFVGAMNARLEVSLRSGLLILSGLLLLMWGALVGTVLIAGYNPSEGDWWMCGIGTFAYLVTGALFCRGRRKTEPVGEGSA